jgi:ribosomal protein S10
MLDLLWSRESETLHDRLAARGVVDSETGERFTVRRIDEAIQSAVGEFNAREHARVIDIFEPTWRMLSADVARFLGVEADELDGVRP